MIHEETLIMQNKVIISLLGRAHFPEDRLKSIITKNKRFPGAYLLAYNACDGKTNVTDIAGVIGVAQSTLTPILKEWEHLGIVYSVDIHRGKNYVRLYKLNISKEEIQDVKITMDKQDNPEGEISKSDVNQDTKTDESKQIGIKENV